MPRGSTRVDVDLEPGRYLVVVEKGGYTPFERRVQLEAGAAVVVRARLNPIRAAPSPDPAGGEASRAERQAKLQAERQHACEQECHRFMARCEQEMAAALEAHPEAHMERCGAEARVRCEGVYEQCLSAASIVGGAVSVDSECTGKAYECERELMAKCEREAAPSARRCDEEVNECLRACR